MAKTWVGISGWTFPGWRGTFYPEDLSQKKELSYASRQLNSIEINGTFYSLQKPETFQRWYQQAPDNFQYAVKAPQYITHIRRLKEVEEPLANFFASGLLCLKEKLGPILWQFPPNVMLKDDRFEIFLSLLPQNAKTATRLARKHGDKVEGRAHTKAEGITQIRHAFEFRHKSFLNKDFLERLRAHNVAFVFAHEGGERAPYTEEPTADFIYARLHGEGKRYKKGYPDKDLSEWASKVNQWNRKGLEAFVYFSNEAKVYSPVGAIKLLKRLGVDLSDKKRKKAA